MGWISRLRNRDKGASLVEFAILAPFLILLLLGIIEFGWGLAQQIDVRHKAREALRIAIVDGTEAEVETRICDNSIVKNADITSIARGGNTTTGDPATVSVVANVSQITGFFGWAWGPSPTITSAVEGRVEQEPTDWQPGEDLITLGYC